jgi:hypothetical protein
MTRRPVGSGDALGGDNLNATHRDRMTKGWPQDVGSAGADPSAAQGINQWPGANPTTVKHPSALDYQTYEAVPGQQHVVVHKGIPVGYVSRYQDPGHGPLWSATLADGFHARNPTAAQTQRGFVHASDAHGNLMERHRDVAQIENVGSWRPGPVNAGPNLPGH